MPASCRRQWKTCLVSWDLKEKENLSSRELSVLCSRENFSNSMEVPKISACKNSQLTLWTSLAELIFPCSSIKEFVYMGEALRTDSWLKCGSFEGGAPSGMMGTTHKKCFFFLAPFFNLINFNLQNHSKIVLEWSGHSFMVRNTKNSYWGSLCLLEFCKRLP